MSGGHFDYQQYQLNNIADQIEELISSNDDETLNKWGQPRGHGFSAATVAEFKTAVRLLRQAYVYAQRIDWLVSDDDSEKSFHRRLKDDLSALELYPPAGLHREGKT